MCNALQYTHAMAVFQNTELKYENNNYGIAQQRNSSKRASESRNTKTISKYCAAVFGEPNPNFIKCAFKRRSFRLGMKGKFFGWKWHFRMVQLLCGIFATRQSHKLCEMAFLSEQTQKTVSNGAYSQEKKNLAKNRSDKKNDFLLREKNINKKCMGLLQFDAH